MQSGLVEADDDLTVDHNDRDGHASGEPEQILSGLGVLKDVHILKGDTLRRKKLFRRAAGASGGTGVHGDRTRHEGLPFYDALLGAARMIVS